MKRHMKNCRLFYHECLRVFHDRLINLEDKSYFYHLVTEMCWRSFGDQVVPLPPGELIIERPPLLFFGDFMSFGAPPEHRTYEEIFDLDKMKSILRVGSKFFVAIIPRTTFFSDNANNACVFRTISTIIA